MSPAAPTVIDAVMPAATLGSMCVCVGPPDSVNLGSFTVPTCSKPTARMRASTVHGGTIVLGAPTVIVR